MLTAGPLRPWEIASVIFFAYTAAAALAVSGLPGRQRAQALKATVAGIGLTVASILVPRNAVLHEWVLPPLLLLLAYWASGRLFVAPMPAAERALMRIDRALDVTGLAARTPRAVAELLEVAYAGVYPLIPIALVIYLLGTSAPDPSRFWTVILVTDYVCFSLLPWVQTRPPRAIEPAAPWRSTFRPVNLRLLGATSIQVNTFPSGHAAEALAAALLVISAPLPLAIGMFVAALAISAGAVGGRYHYAADAVLGWLVAVVVWLLESGRP
jgi:hypothetical protein